MTQHNIFNRRGNDTTISTIVSGIVFCFFSFTYLYCYQCDLLTMEQHILSHGVTQYDKLIGAVIITVLLMLIQFAVDSFTRRCIKLPALTYMPSAVFLAMIADVSPHIDTGYQLGKWVWLAPAMLLTCILTAYLSARMPANSNGTNSETQIHVLRNNMLIMLGLIAFVSMTANSDKTFHTRLHIENLIKHKKYDEALMADKSITDSTITMLRAYALSQKGELGEKLFEYATCGGSDALLPNGTSVKCMICSDADIYNHVGVMTKQRMRTAHYLAWAKKHRYGKEPIKDYILCGYLLDKQIEKFAKELKETEEEPQKLPKHYREALVLYNHIRSNPMITYRNDVMEADYSDLQTIMKTHNNPKERKALIRSSYGNTYWYYYFFSE